MTNTQEYNRQYYLKNRDNILQNAKEKVICCGCGRCVNRQNLKKHQETQYHKSRVVENSGMKDARLDDLEHNYNKLMVEHERLQELIKQHVLVRDPREWKVKYVHPEELIEAGVPVPDSN